MKFEKLFEQFIIEKEIEKEDSLFSWTIEITKDPQKSEKYNLLGELIILLSQLRNKLK